MIQTVLVGASQKQFESFTTRLPVPVPKIFAYELKFAETGEGF